MAAPRRPTVRDIAHRLDLSVSTVSRALNGSRLASEPTRERIMEVAEEMGYHKRRTRRHGNRAILVVALFLPHSDVPYRHLFYDPAELIAGIEAGFEGVKVHVVTSLNEQDPDIFGHKRLGNLDGAVFGFTTPMREVAEHLKRQEIPTVLLNRVSRSFNYVSCDNREGMRELLRRVISCREEVFPCHISYSPARPVARYREHAFLEACKTYELPAGKDDVFRVQSLEEIDGAMIEEIRRRGYNTVVCFNDFVAVYFYQIALAKALRIPEEMSLTGFDNSPVRQLTPRKIDTIALSPFDLGREAGQWLKEAIIERSAEGVHRMVTGEYIPGETICRKGSTPSRAPL
jgi:LacI family transcriptional regulator